MTADFRIEIASDEPSAGPPLRVLESQGVSWGYLPEEKVAIALLGTNGHEEAALTLARAYVASGRKPATCSRPPGGAAGCAVIDQALPAVRVVAPAIGQRLIFWGARQERISVASSPRRLGVIAAGGAAIRLDALYQYVYFHMIPAPASIFEGVEKLSSGHWLDWNRRGTKLNRHWQPRFDDQPSLGEDEAVRELHRVLRAGVGRALDRAPATGAFLSGGLDSSTVAGLAAEQRPGIATVSMGFDAQGYDEMEFARIASRRFGTRALEYYVTPEDVQDTLPSIAAAFAEPFGNSSAAAAYHCARIAREHGLCRLLAGDGGDELFGGNERYAWQLVFEHYQRIPRPLRTGLLEPLVRAASRVTRTFPIGKAAGYIEQANVPLPDRLQSYNFLHRHAPAEVFNADLLRQVDTAEPLRRLREEFAVPATGSAVNRMLFLDWKFTLHDNDLVKVNAMCQLAGVEVAYPMLDPEVVDFSLKVPGDWKVHRGELRWFYKRAMRGFLPDEIIGKTKHGFGLPFGVWTRTHAGLRRLSEDALASLRQRGYFRPKFLDEALRLHREGHASYYGELVWILTVLELWLQANAPGATFG